MRKNNKTCVICGKIYTYCSSCEDFATVPRWKNAFHNENCKNLFEIASQYDNKEISKDEATKLFSECDLSYRKDVVHYIKRDLDELLPIAKPMVASTALDEIKGVEAINEENKPVTGVNKNRKQGSFDKKPYRQN